MFGMLKSKTASDESLTTTTVVIEAPANPSSRPASYRDKLRDTIFWNLSTRRPFIVNDEYKVELLSIDFNTYTARIKVTNIKTNEESFSDMEFDSEQGNV